MRQVGTIQDEPDARRFAAYLVTQEITAHAEEESEGWAIWVRDENHMDKAREEIEFFKLDPNDPRYRGAEREAEELLRRQLKKQQAAQKNVVEMRSKWGTAAVRKSALTLSLLAICVIVTFLRGFSESRQGLAQLINTQFVFCDPEFVDADPWHSIKQGQVWRIVTPIFLHGNILHLAFNMLWLYVLGSRIETVKGSGRLAILVFSTAIFSNVVAVLLPESLGAAVNGIGISGVVYGLFGYIWMKMIFEPGSGLYVSPFVIGLVLFLMFYGFTGGLDRGGATIDNWAHVLGLVCGMAIGYAPVFAVNLKRRSK